ncbi:hypothetical protein GGX14DRAFT_426384 [Mycena pura]|uniref:Uncharacterized protein n=1 Tax=Mycena pura TaxID=153505 RepID=A0AAD6YNV6_9AGAR|nr:hypothetical protein GGX14DRAFT_426384 [Mycena pura]
MSSPSKTATAPKPIPTLVPTLLIPASAPALAHVPTEANEKLKVVLASASVGSVMEDFDPELDVFFDGNRDDASLAPAEDTRKGKAPATPPPPPPPPAPPNDTTEGASTSALPIFKRLGFTPDAKLPSRFAVGDHRTTRTHLAAMATEMARLDDKLAWVQNDLTDAADSLNTQITSLGDFVNGQVDKRSAILADLADRMAVVEGRAATGYDSHIEARLDSLTEVTQKILARISTLSDTSPPIAPALAAVPAPPSAKELRARDDEPDDSSRNVRQNTSAVHIPHAQLALRTPVDAPATISLPEQVPAISLFPPVSTPAPLPPSPPVSGSLFPPTSTAAPLPLPLIAPPSAPPVTTSAYPSAPAAMQTAASPLTHQVLFGPINFGHDPKLAKGDMARIIAHILPNAGRLTFRLRRAGDRNHTFAVFDSEDIATWVVAAWAATNGTRSQYEIVTARTMGPNA